MSEPVSNVEIEDVLSSIRRLVSEEHRSELRPGPKKPPVQSDRLVLTPALRVAEFPKPDPVGEPDSPDSSGAGQDVLPDSDSGSDVVSASAPVFAPEPAPDPAEKSSGEPEWPESVGIAEDVDPSAPEADEGLQDTAWLTPKPLSVTESDPEAADDTAEMQPANDAPDMADGAPWHDPGATLFKAAQFTGDALVAEAAETPSDDNVEDSGDDLPETAAAQPGSAEADTPDDISGDISDAGQPEVAEPAAAPFGQMAGNSWFSDTPAQAGQLRADAEDTPAEFTKDAQLDRTAALSAKIEALEATIGQTQDQWEPDGEIGDDYAGTHVKTIEWQDHDSAGDTTAEPLRPTPLHPESIAETPFTPIQEEDPLDMMASDETILDEESLRELVADIVRQELQGALGERITRNVRKLVRREIHRALTAQELD